MIISERLANCFEKEWLSVLTPFLQTVDFENIGKMLAYERTKYNVYPTELETIFRAFRETPFNSIKVVILLQDPYHTKGIADGLALSCSNFPHPQPSLKNVLIEIEDDCYNNTIDMLKPEYYNLQRWAKQGVLLLNTALTVREGQPNSHEEMWKRFSQFVISQIAERNTGIIFMLWGKKAQVFQQFIDPFVHHILITDHPQAPNYGSHNSKMWFGNKHFSTANRLLEEMNGKDATITW